jgi:GTP-binding protein LepA
MSNTYDQSKLRNVCIIAHIDHGKSTLADRFLEVCGAVDKRDMRSQYLDTMDLERERGITIKAQNVRLKYKGFNLQFIDTPGHVDFSYEVSRSLAACEGAILLVDASQGIEAQTLATCYSAMDHDLTIVAAVNKVDLPAAEPEKVAQEIETIIGIPADEVIQISAKTGKNVEALLDAVIEKIPEPKGDENAPLQALLFDSTYDTFRGVISSIRVSEGRLNLDQPIFFLQSGTEHKIEELGIRTPLNVKVKTLGPGEVGYVIAGIKNVREAKVGETITTPESNAEPLQGYLDPKPMVFCGLYPTDGDQYPDLRDSLEKLQLNDASFSFEPETSTALGFGFRCGFLGLLHMEIIRERLEREYDLALVATAPNVEYKILKTNGEEILVDNPSDLPTNDHISKIYEPYMKVSMVAPSEYVGTIMDLAVSRRGEMQRMDYLSTERVELVYHIPLAEIVLDFFDRLKSRTKGYASLDYEPLEYRESKLVKVDIMLNGEVVDSFSSIIHDDSSYHYGRRMVEKLKELIPTQLFDVPIQASIGSKVIARENVRAKRKDVLAKCYGGDVSRKKKLLSKQKAGKKRMKAIGRIEVPPEAFVAALQLEDE